LESAIKTVRLRIGGMTCVSCQNKIEKRLRNTAGVQSVQVSYSAGTAGVTYDADMISLKDIRAVIEKLDYKVLPGEDRQAPDTNRIFGLLLIIAALYFLLRQFGILNLLVPSQLAETNMGYGMLFVIGLITSVHCVAMCGGINLSQCIPQGEAGDGESRFAALRPTFLYNLGRVASYTAVGFIVGALGSAITFSNTFQGMLKLVAGVFMIIMGINMLGLFPWLRKLNPRMPKIFASRIDTEKGRSKSPLIVGLLNGLMPCGPLQAMQIYALSTGNPFTGALSMFLFSAGTVPLMFALGALSTVLSKKFTHKMMTVGAVLVVVLGLSMLSQGWNLSGFTLPSLLPQSASRLPDATIATDVKTENGVQVVNSTLASGSYPNITVQVGTPVKWVIDAPKGSVNGCNNRMFIQEYGIEHPFKTGENVVEFTPTKTGRFQYSCWMGMIHGSITVVEAGANVSETTNDEEAAYAADSGIAPVSVSANFPADPVPAGVAIPTQNVAVAKQMTDEYGYEYQQATIELTDQGFSPALVIVQYGVETQWSIVNKSLSAEYGAQLLVPAFSTQLPLKAGETPLYFYPSDSFDFSTDDNAFYGYVKVVDSLDTLDAAGIEAIQEEVASYETLIYPPEYYFTGADGDSGASCH
jgi:sulfite exporter TauE/SafE/copper chaperone CopZ/plastocyanin domain-containing protein